MKIINEFSKRDTVAFWLTILTGGVLLVAMITVLTIYMLYQL